MHRKDLFVNDGGNGQTVKAVSKGLPQLDVVAALALVVETVDAVDGRALVVAAQNEKVFGVFDLVREQKANGFQRLFAAVNVVAEKKVVGFRREAAVLKKTEQVVVLAVDVATNLGDGLVKMTITTTIKMMTTIIIMKIIVILP